MLRVVEILKCIFKVQESKTNLVSILIVQTKRNQF